MIASSWDDIVDHMETPRINAEHIGKQMKALRQGKGWSLHALSAVLATMEDPESGEPISVGRGALGKWETGANTIPIRYLVPLAMALDTTPTVLLIGIPNGEADAGVNLAGHKVSLQRAYEWAYGEQALVDTEDGIEEVKNAVRKLLNVRLSPSEIHVHIEGRR